jgi:hypothetical protein
LLPPLGSSGLESPFESDLFICRSSIPDACDSSLIEYSIPNQNPHRHMGYAQFTSPFVTVNPPHSCDFLDFELPLYEVIFEAMTRVYIPWEDSQHGLCFLPFCETI